VCSLGVGCSACQRDSAETRTCMRQAVCYRVQEVSPCAPLTTIPEAISCFRTVFHNHPTSLTNGLHPTRSRKTLASALRKDQVILRHSFTRPATSIATSATRDPANTARTAAFLRLRILLRKRCRNRPVQHSRKACVRDSDGDDLACLALRIAYTTLPAPPNGRKGTAPSILLTKRPIPASARSTHTTLPH
jgi:hypothetical protein